MADGPKVEETVMAEAVREQGKQSWLALFIPPLIAAAIWFLDSSVAIKPLEGSVYDLAARTAAATPPRVLLLEHPPDGFADRPDAAVKILTTLKELGARQVVFLSAPPDAPRAFFELAAQHGNVVFGRSVVADERATRWADVPAAAAGLPLDCGAVALPRRSTAWPGNNARRMSWGIKRCPRSPSSRLDSGSALTSSFRSRPSMFVFAIRLSACRAWRSMLFFPAAWFPNCSRTKPC